VCPVDCIPLHPDYVETHDDLMQKYHRLTASKVSEKTDITY
jgi:hypothetical protein